MEGAEPTELAGAANADTESVYAWALDDDEQTDEVSQRLTPRRITAMAVGGALALMATAGGLALWTLRSEPDAAQRTPASSTTVTSTAEAPAAPSPVAVATPSPKALSGIDGQFIEEVRGYGVPVSDRDPDYTVKTARAMCATARDSPTAYPPGTHTMNKFVTAMLELNSEWTRQQAYRFVNSAADYYCPDVRGIGTAAIAALPPDARFLAMLQDRLGITPSDGTLLAGGRQVCALRATGQSLDQIVDGMNSPNPREDERVIVETAVSVFCPQYG